MHYSFPKGHIPWNKGLVGFMASEKHYNFGKKRPGIGGKPKGFTAWNKGKTFVMSEKWKQAISKSLKGKPQIHKKRFTEKELYQKRLFKNGRRRVMKKNASGSHSFQEWQDLKIFYNFMCLCCKKFEPEIILTEDHIIPLSMGGNNYIDNIQPLCRRCNSKKHTKTISYLPLSSNNLNLEEKGLVN